MLKPESPTAGAEREKDGNTEKGGGAENRTGSGKLRSSKGTVVLECITLGRRNPVNNILCLIAGESGSGKDTLADLVCRRHPELRRVLSSTTREKRTQDEDAHIFLPDEKFERRRPGIGATTELCGAKYCAESEVINASDIYNIDSAGI